MTPTEVFLLFLRKGLEPNERLAFTREIRNGIRNKDSNLCHNTYWNEPQLFSDELEKKFAERLIYNTSGNLRNPFGGWGCSSTCTCLTSFMKYLLYYVPTIIGTSKCKNKYLEREGIAIPKEVGYKRFWQRRLIKKWHDFLKENIRNGEAIFIYRSDIPDYKLKEGVKV